MRKLFGVVIAILIVVLVFSFAKDVLIKVSVEKGTEVVTGLRLKIQSLKVGIINTSAGIKNLKLYNPRGYRDRVMLDMPEIYVNYDLTDILRGTIHLTELRINLKEFIVVKNEKGELNLDALKVVRQEKEGKKVEKGKKGKMPNIQIDLLELKIGKVLYKDYSKGSEPSIQEFKISHNATYRDINDPNKLVALIVVKALMDTTISRLTNFDLGGLESTVADTLKTATNVTSEVAFKATEETGKAVGVTTDAVKKTAEGLSEVFSLPFGGSKEKK